MKPDILGFKALFLMWDTKRFYLSGDGKIPPVSVEVILCRMTAEFESLSNNLGQVLTASSIVKDVVILLC